MLRSTLAALALTAASLLPPALTSSLAQAPANRPDPSDAAATVPAINYQSPFARYHAFADEDLAPWRETNDTAARIGGWRAYAREASQPAPATETSSPATDAGESRRPMPAGRHMHHGGTQ